MIKDVRREIFKFLSKFVIMIISLTFFVIYYERFKINPLEREKKIIPNYLSLDSEDNIYILENSWRKIHKIDKNGKIIFTLEGGDKNSYLYEIWGINVDFKNNLYVLNVVYDVETQILEREEVLKYKPDGSFDKSIFILDYKVLKKEISTDNYSIRVISTYQDKVFVLIRESKEVGGVYRIKDNNEIEKIVTIANPDFVSSIGVMSDKIVVLYTTNKIMVHYYDNNYNPQNITNITKLLKEGSFLYGVSIDNTFYFCDSWQREIRGFSFNEKKEKVLISKENLKKKGYDYKKVHFSYLHSNYNTKRMITLEAFSHNLINFDTEGNINFVVKSFTISSRELFFNILVFVSFLIFLYFFGDILYNYIFVKYVSIIIKIIFLTIPVVIYAIFYTTSRSYEELYSKIEKGLSDRIKLLAGIASIYLDLSNIDKIKSPSNYDEKYVSYLIDHVKNITDIGEVGSLGFFISILVIRNNDIYIVGDKYSGIFSPHIYPDNYYDKVFNEGVLKIGKYSNDGGNFIAAALPVKNDNGEVICVIEVAAYLDEYEEIKSNVKNDIVKNIVVFTILFILVLNFVILVLIYPLKTIRNAMKEVENGNLEKQVKIKRKDEIGDIGKAFNNMTKSLIEKEKIRGLMNKVVSKEIAEKLLKEGIKFEGERIEGTVLFADIRGFTKMCETMQPEEVIEMLNHYFNKMAKVINQNYGIIDKYVGDQIMAVYGILLPILNDNGEKLDAFYAVKTAVELMKTCEEINREREALNKKPIRIGIGINRGDFVAGNLGSEDRLNYTIIGDNVNLGARLCSNAPEMTILINESVYEMVKGCFNIEKLEPIYVKGKSRPINVYKVVV